MINEMRGVPGVLPGRLAEGLTVKVILTYLNLTKLTLTLTCLNLKQTNPSLNHITLT